MGAAFRKAVSRPTGFWKRIVDLYLKGVQQFIDFADAGFGYIDIPRDVEYKRPKKRGPGATLKCEDRRYFLNPAFQY